MNIDVNENAHGFWQNYNPYYNWAAKLFIIFISKKMSSDSTTTPTQYSNFYI